MAQNNKKIIHYILNYENVNTILLDKIETFERRMNNKKADCEVGNLKFLFLINKPMNTILPVREKGICGWVVKQ